MDLGMGSGEEVIGEGRRGSHVALDGKWRGRHRRAKERAGDRVPGGERSGWRLKV